MTHDPEHAKGLLATVSSYVLWGVMPLYFLLLTPAGPAEVVGWRIVFSLGFCAILLTMTNGWRRILVIIRERRLLWLTLLAGALIYGNWQIFTIGTLTGHVVETSLGYFINPIFTVLLGVLVLREPLRPLQWVAVGLAAVAVLIVIIGLGTIPWIARGLAATFGTYGLVKKFLGPRVDALSGMTLETVWLLPVAVIQLTVVSMTAGVTIGTAGTWHVVLLALAGIVTAVPLLLFAASTRRVPLSLVGILQFITPMMQFAIGVFIQHESMPPERWAGFVVVWAAVLLFTIDSAGNVRRSRSSRS